MDSASARCIPVRQTSRTWQTATTATRIPEPTPLRTSAIAYKTGVPAKPNRQSGWSERHRASHKNHFHALIRIHVDQKWVGYPETREAIYIEILDEGFRRLPNSAHHLWSENQTSVSFLGNRRLRLSP